MFMTSMNNMIIEFIVTSVFAGIGVLCLLLFIGLKLFYDEDCSLLPGFLGFLFTTLIAGFSYINNLPYCLDYYNKCEANIISLKSNDNQLEGNFNLGFGKIKTETYYIYYSDLGDNKYELGKIPANKTTIIESDVETPHVQHIKEQWEYDYYELYVPEGTIKITWEL